MSMQNEIALRLGFYKNRAKLNYLLASGKWKAYYCLYMDEDSLEVPKLRRSEIESKLPKIIRITSKPCFNETTKIYEYHAIEGVPGTVNWFGKMGATEDKEDRRIFSAAIEAGERIAKANFTPDLFAILKNYANWLPIVLLALQIATLMGIWVILNPS